MYRFLVTFLILVTLWCATPVWAQAPGEVIPGRYLVVIVPSAAVEAVAQTSSVLAGVQVVQRLDQSVHGFVIEIAPGANAAAILETLRRDPSVQSVSPDRAAGIMADTVTSGHARIRATPLPSSNIGTGIRVAILDTGIDLVHPDLSANINKVDSVTCLVSPCAVGGQDDHYHGTFVAGIVAASTNDAGLVGVAPGVELIAVKVLNSAGSGSFTQIVAGLDHLTALNASGKRVHIANMSLGGTCSVCTENSTDPTILAMQTAIRRLRDSGTTVVVAAGNNAGNAASTVPAAFPEVVTVSAMADTDGLPGGLGGAGDDIFASFSNFGGPVDVTAPGVNITGVALGGTTRVGSGTSFSSPYAAGVAALFIKSRVDAGLGLPTPQLVQQALVETGECFTDAGSRHHGGVGCGPLWPGDKDMASEPMVRADLVVQFGTLPTPTTPPPGPLPTHDLALFAPTCIASGVIGSTQSIFVTIRNNGNVDDTVTLQASDTVGSAFTNMPAPFLLPLGMTRSVTLSWTPSVPDIHRLTFSVLPVVDEKLVSNNVAKLDAVANVAPKDLILTALTPTPPYTVGTPVVIRATVRNNSPTTETAVVRLVDSFGDPIAGSPQSVVVTSGASAVVSFTWTVTTRGAHTFTGSIDALADEGDTANNTLTTVVTACQCS